MVPTMRINCTLAGDVDENISKTENTQLESLTATQLKANKLP